jgi:flavodoxin I
MSRMNILVIYDTYSSSTETAVAFATDILKTSQHTVKIIKAHEADPTSFSNFDLVILASPSWWVDEKDGQPHIHYKDLFAKAENMNFSSQSFAIFGLGDSTYAHFCGAVDCLEKFVKDHEGKLVVESLRIDSFYFDQANNEEILKRWILNLLKTLSL